jgi:Tfp pilus assembly protein PilV
MIRSESGQSLIDVLIALVIFVVGVLAVAVSLRFAQHSNLVSERESVATQAAEGDGERYGALSWATLLPSTASVTPTGSCTRTWSSVGTAVGLDMTTALASSAAGQVPGMSTWQTTVAGNTTVRGCIYRFLTPSGSQRRLTIAVTLVTGPPNQPLFVSTLRSDPNAGALGAGTGSLCNLQGVICP